MSDNLDEILRLNRLHGDGDLDTDKWITATQALTQEDP